MSSTMRRRLAVAAVAVFGARALVSFGHSTWFGIGAYAAGLIQLHWFRGEIWLPLLLSMIVVALASTVVGVIILRRRGVYFSLLTLALAALTYTTAFRWSSLTGANTWRSTWRSEGRNSASRLCDSPSSDCPNGRLSASKIDGFGG